MSQFSGVAWTQVQEGNVPQILACLNDTKAIGLCKWSKEGAPASVLGVPQGWKPTQDKPYTRAPQALHKGPPSPASLAVQTRQRDTYLDFQNRYGSRNWRCQRWDWSLFWNRMSAIDPFSFELLHEEMSETTEGRGVSKGNLALLLLFPTQYTNSKTICIWKKIFPQWRRGLKSELFKTDGLLLISSYYHPILPPSALGNEDLLGAGKADMWIALLWRFPGPSADTKICGCSSFYTKWHRICI